MFPAMNAFISYHKRLAMYYRALTRFWPPPASFAKVEQLASEGGVAKRESKYGF